MLYMYDFFSVLKEILVSSLLGNVNCLTPSIFSLDDHRKKTPSSCLVMH